MIHRLFPERITQHLDEGNTYEEITHRDYIFYREYTMLRWRIKHTKTTYIERLLLPENA
jgi:hypothetical protein